MSNDMELLSKADVLREYRYPKHQLDADLESKALKAFSTTDGYGGGRWYIPRVAVEQRIAELAGLPAREG